MNKSESIDKLIIATIGLMEDIENIEKSMTVGTGNQSYSAVADIDVKRKTREAFVKHGLAIFPTDVNSSIQIDRWEHTDKYGTKMKQSTFTELITSYTLGHKSGQWIEVKGYGHGIDAQDKGAGKATTYALKNLLLYMGLVPTGDIDDTDKTHSNNMEVPVKKTPPEPSEKPKPTLSPKHKQWNYCMCALAEETTTIEQIKESFTLSDENKQLILDEALEKQNNNTKKTA